MRWLYFPYWRLFFGVRKYLRVAYFFFFINFFFIDNQNFVCSFVSQIGITDLSIQKYFSSFLKLVYSCQLLWIICLITYGTKRWTKTIWCSLIAHSSGSINFKYLDWRNPRWHWYKVQIQFWRVNYFYTNKFSNTLLKLLLRTFWNACSK